MRARNAQAIFGRAMYSVLFIYLNCSMYFVDIEATQNMP